MIDEPERTEPQINVRDHGATGDGETDDTAAIRSAIEALPEKGGVIFFPAGHYLSGPIRVPHHTTLLGRSAWAYKTAGGTVISPLDADQNCLVDLQLAQGVRVIGLDLQGRDLGEEIHGILSCKDEDRDDSEQNLVIDDCRITHFSGSGISMTRCHVWCIRHNLIAWNRLDGIDGHNSFDAWVIDNQIGHNGRYGFHFCSSTTITGNRLEQNGVAGLRGSDYYLEDSVVTGNHFCTEYGTGIEIAAGEEPDANIRGLTITGNLIRNSARRIEGENPRNCHIRLSGVGGVTCTGNVLHALRQSMTPHYGIVLENLQNCVIANNSLHKGAMGALIHDLGGHEGTIIKDNAGSIKDPNDVRA